jgi:glucosamine-6-phosphate deaminase
MFKLFKKKHKVVRFIPCINSQEISDFVVRDLLLEVKNNNSLNIGFAGSDCLKDILSKFAYNLNKHEINYANINFFNVFEFHVTTERDNKYPYANFMTEEFYSKLKIKSDHIFEIHKEEDQKIEDFLNKHDLDVVVIEPGINGTVAFNNHDVLKSKSIINKIKLNESIRDECINLFDGQKFKIPLYGYAINMKTILRAKKIIVLCSGINKASTTAKLLEQEISPS